MCSLTNKSLFSQIVHKPLISLLKAEELNYILVGLDISPTCARKLNAEVPFTQGLLQLQVQL